MDNDEIVNQLDNIFESYKKYLYGEYNKTGILTYKNALITSILNRSLAIIEAYKTLISTNNIIALNSLIRMQIDNCIFVYGVYLLNNNGYTIKEIFNNIINGNKKLSKYKIEKGKLHDTYIVEQIDNEYKNNFLNMYSFYCRFIHFSDSALLTSIDAKEENVLEVEYSKDYSRFEKYTLQNGKSLIELCKFLLIMIDTKWNNIENTQM